MNKYPPFYRVKWCPKKQDFEIMVKFKFSKYEDAKNKLEELMEFEPYISRDKNSSGKTTYTVYINKQDKVMKFCEERNWKDKRKNQQRRIDFIKSFLMSRMSELGMLMIKKEKCRG